MLGLLLVPPGHACVRLLRALTHLPPLTLVHLLDRPQGDALMTHTTIRLLLASELAVILLALAAGLTGVLR